MYQNVVSRLTYSKVRTEQDVQTCFCFCDLDLDTMILIYERAIDILKMYLHTKNEVSRSTFSKVKAQTGQKRQTDTQTDQCDFRFDLFFSFSFSFSVIF